MVPLLSVNVVCASHALDQSNNNNNKKKTWNKDDLRKLKNNDKDTIVAVK